MASADAVASGLTTQTVTSRPKVLGKKYLISRKAAAAELEPCSALLTMLTP